MKVLLEFLIYLIWDFSFILLKDLLEFVFVITCEDNFLLA